MAGTSLKHPRDYKLPYSLNWKKKKKQKKNKNGIHSMFL